MRRSAAAERAGKLLHHAPNEHQAEGLRRLVDGPLDDPTDLGVRGLRPGLSPTVVPARTTRNSRWTKATPETRGDTGRAP
jgi:hypothetical protein